MKKSFLLIFMLFLFLSLFGSSFCFATDYSFTFANAKKYVTKPYGYDHKVPLLLISIKNSGSTPLSSSDLVCNVSFLDLDNKRVISAYQRNLLNEFEIIPPGFTSPLFDITILDIPKCIISLIGQNPINFKIRLELTLKPYRINLPRKKYETVFNPIDYNDLPLWKPF